MGNYFANLHIKKEAHTADAVKKKVAEYMKSCGYIPTEKGDADISVSLYAPESSAWVSVYSEAFVHTDVLALTPLLSEHIASDVLCIACVDSDYLFLQLLNTEKKRDLWLNIGSSYELKAPKRNTLAAWKKAVTDYEGFKTAAAKKYVFAEDFLREVQGQLDISYEQSIGNVAEDAVERLYYKNPDKKPSEPPTLELFLPSMMPCRPGERSSLFVKNVGGASRGVCAMFIGDYVEHDEIVIDEATFSSHGTHGEWIDRPITFEKRQTKTGTWIYYWQDPDFVLPPSVSESLPPQIKMRKESDRSFGIRYTLSGDPRKFLDVCPGLAPLQNLENGFCGWLVWNGFPSKRAYIDAHNESEREMAQYGKPPEFFNPDDYDLD